MSAAIFLENADAASLTISPLEFERAIQRCKELSEEQAKKRSSLFTFHQFGDSNVADFGHEQQTFRAGASDVKNSSRGHLGPLLPSLSIHDVRGGKSAIRDMYLRRSRDMG